MKYELLKIERTSVENWEMMVKNFNRLNITGYEIIKDLPDHLSVIVWYEDPEEIEGLKMKLANLSPMLAGSNGTISISTETVRAPMPEELRTANGEFFKATFIGGPSSNYGFEVGKSYLIFCKITDNTLHVMCNGSKDEHPPIDYIASSLKQFISEWDFYEESMQIKTSTD